MRLRPSRWFAWGGATIIGVTATLAVCTSESLQRRISAAATAFGDPDRLRPLEEEPTYVQLPLKHDGELDAALAAEFREAAGEDLDGLGARVLELVPRSFPLPVTRRTVRYVRYLTEDPAGRTAFEQRLRRYGRYREVLLRELRKHGLADELVWVAAVESGFDPSAQSPKGAMGLWQFMPDTGDAYGLERTAYVDERRSIQGSTDAAARYLKHLHARLERWDLALAAYNAGPAAIERAMDRAYRLGELAPHTGDLARLGLLPKETADYVPRVLAFCVVAQHRGEFGFADAELDEPLSPDYVWVPEGATLELIARAADISVAQLREHNPELLTDQLAPAGGLRRIALPADRTSRLGATFEPLARAQAEAWEHGSDENAEPREHLDVLNPGAHFAVDGLGPEHEPGVAVVRAIPEAGASTQRPWWGNGVLPTFGRLTPTPHDVDGHAPSTWGTAPGALPSAVFDRAVGRDRYGLTQGPAPAWLASLGPGLVGRDGGPTTDDPLRSVWDARPTRGDLGSDESFAAAMANTRRAHDARAADVPRDESPAAPCDGVAQLAEVAEPERFFLSDDVEVEVWRDDDVDKVVVELVVGQSSAGGVLSLTGSTQRLEVPPRDFDLAARFMASRLRIRGAEGQREELAILRRALFRGRRRAMGMHPQGAAWLALADGLFHPGHALEGTVLGVRASDTEALDELMLAALHRKGPPSVRIRVEGPVSADALRPALGDALLAVASTPEVVESQPRPVDLRRQRIAVRGDEAHLLIGFDGPPQGAAVDPALRVALELLAGRDGRFDTVFAEERELVTQWRTVHHVSSFGGAAAIDIVPALQVPVETVEEELWDAVDDLARNPADPRELDHVRGRLRMRVVREQALARGDGEESSATISRRLARSREALMPNSDDALLAGLGAVSAADVQRAATEWLTKERAVVVVSIPEGRVSAGSGLGVSLIGAPAK